MKNINFSIQSEPTSEPIIVHIKVSMRNFSEVKLYIPKVNGKPTVLPKHRWYVYYYFRNPITKKMERFKEYCKINYYKTVYERKKVGEASVAGWVILLNQGFSPHEKLGIVPKQFEETIYTVKTGMQYAFDNKIGSWEKATADDYRTRKGVFIDWCTANSLDGIDIRELREIHVITFMNWLISPTGRAIGGTSQDNYKRCLSGLFGKLVKDKIVIKNLFTEIETKKDDPIKNTPFTGYEVREIRDYLLVNDLELYHFIQFVIYTFLRPREIIRLTVEDINLREKYLRVKTKAQRRSIKKLVGPIIPFFEKINVAGLPSKANIFTNTGQIEVWTASEKAKVDHFGNRFKKVKEHFKYGKDYGIYSFRHTAAMDLFFSFIKQGLTEREAILKLMPITGHASETALRNYLRDIGGMLPKDYGSDYTLDF